MKRFVLISILTTLAIALPTIALSGTNSTSSGTTGTLQIVPTTCGVTTNPSSLDFGSFVAGKNSAVIPMTITMTGNFINESVALSGTNWTSTQGSFLVNSTLFGANNPPNLALSATPFTFITTNTSGSNATVFWQVLTGFALTPANYTQNITFTLNCF